MSILQLGPVIFRETDRLITYLQTHGKQPLWLALCFLWLCRANKLLRSFHAHMHAFTVRSKWSAIDRVQCNWTCMNACVRACGRSPTSRKCLLEVYFDNFFWIQDLRERSASSCNDTQDACAHTCMHVRTQLKSTISNVRAQCITGDWFFNYTTVFLRY